MVHNGCPLFRVGQAGVVPVVWQQQVHRLVFWFPLPTLAGSAAGDKVRLLSDGRLSAP